MDDNIETFSQTNQYAEADSEPEDDSVIRPSLVIAQRLVHLAYGYPRRSHRRATLSAAGIHPPIVRAP
jgi:hypothetical protein